MAKTIDAKSLKAAVHGPGEIALLDVREVGTYSQGHPLFSVPLSYSRLELDAERLLPRKTVPTVVFDSGEGVAAGRRVRVVVAE